jgi:hypothetical protein
MTRRAPGFAHAFLGRWRITEMDEWDEIDLLGSAHITFSGKDSGELVFIAIEADLDVRYGPRDGAAGAEFLGRGSTTAAPPTVAAGPRWAPPGVSSATSSSTKATIQPSSPNASDFFNSLLVLGRAHAQLRHDVGFATARCHVSGGPKGRARRGRSR